MLGKFSVFPTDHIRFATPLPRIRTRYTILSHSLLQAEYHIKLYLQNIPNDLLNNVCNESTHNLLAHTHTHIHYTNARIRFDEHFPAENLISKTATTFDCLSAKKQAINLCEKNNSTKLTSDATAGKKLVLNVNQIKEREREKKASQH